MPDHIPIQSQETSVSKHDKFVTELQQLLACYQLATEDERKIVWSVLSKYAHQIIYNG